MKKLAKISIIIALAPSTALADGNILSSLSAQLKYLNQRQSVISQNIANADTPGYKARDLESVDIRKVGKRGSGLKLRTTSSGHLGGNGARLNFKTVKLEDPYETTIDGNNVSLEEQMVKMAQTDMEYQKTIGVMRQMNGLLRSAIGGNK